VALAQVAHVVRPKLEWLFETTSSDDNSVSPPSHPIAATPHTATPSSSEYGDLIHENTDGNLFNHVLENSHTTERHACTMESTFLLPGRSRILMSDMASLPKQVKMLRCGID
jgi:hypothetical protein